MDTRIATGPKDVDRYKVFLNLGLPGPHAYTVLLGLEYFDLPNVLQAVEKGFPFKAFERLMHNMGISSDRLAATIGIPRRTLARRKIEKKFTSEESERLLRGARVFANTLRLFEGDRTLEILVNMRRMDVPEYRAIPCYFHEALVENLDVAKLPGNWSDPIAPAELRQFGDAWVNGRSSAVLKVPSAVTIFEFNYLLNPDYLLNPEHPDFASVDIGDPQPFNSITASSPEAGPNPATPHPVVKYLRAFLTGACMLPVAGTLLSLSRRSHWIFRIWDFPRVQIATIAAGSALAYRAFAWRGKHAERALLAADAAVIAWQCWRIHTYTPVVRPTVQRATEELPDNRIVLMMTNVLQDNRQYGLLLGRVEQEDPDVVIAVEVDDGWMRALEPLTERYPHVVRKPLNNTYGMVLFSRFELIDPRIEFLVQDDIPSIHTRVRLRSGVEVMLHALHPRPPEPIHDQPSAQRDAELVLVGRTVAAEKQDLPTIVAGDLNDVAWSDTSQLFVRIGRLLDPRVGRGFYNSYNARNPLFRYPLDHVFHSAHFKLVRLHRLPAVGSDHFPILIELQYEPLADHEQEDSHPEPGDQELAAEKLAEA